MDSSQRLWAQLHQQGLVNGTMPTTEQHHSPWYIKTMQGVAGWIAAAFLLGAVALSLGWIFDRNAEITLLTIGLCGCLSAYFIIRGANHNNFLEQLGLAISLSGQFIVAWGLIELFSYREATTFFILGGLQFLLAFFMPHFIHRVLSSWFGVICLFIAIENIGIYGLGISLTTLALTLLWVNETYWYRNQYRWEPIGYGLGLALVQLNSHLLFPSFLIAFSESTAMLATTINAFIPWLNLACIGASFLVLTYHLLVRYHIQPRSTQGLLYFGCSGALVLVSWPVMGAASALLIILLGFSTQRRTLLALGIVSLLGFIGWYYYNLETTLLNKSLSLITMGVTLLIGRFLITRYWIKRRNDDVKNTLPRYKITTVGLLTGIIILAAINVAIYQKEQILEHGTPVLLELAPVDPRSLMQGDYMQLRFAIARNAFTQPLEQYPADGHLVVAIDQQGVGRFTRIDNGETLQENEVIMQYRIRNYRVQLATNAFFFEEGSAAIFEKAIYGEFRVATNGELLLSHLRDKDRLRLGENTP